MLHDQVAILLPVHCASSARRGDFLHVGHVLWARRWGELLGQQFLVQEKGGDGGHVAYHSPECSERDRGEPVDANFCKAMRPTKVFWPRDRPLCNNCADQLSFRENGVPSSPENSAGRKMQFRLMLIYVDQFSRSNQIYSFVFLTALFCQEYLQ